MKKSHLNPNFIGRDIDVTYRCVSAFNWGNKYWELKGRGRVVSIFAPKKSDVERFVVVLDESGQRIEFDPRTDHAQWL